MVTGGSDSKVKLWFAGGTDQSKWGLFKDLGEHDQTVNSVAFSPDGHPVVTGGKDKKVKLWFAGGTDQSKRGFFRDLGEHDSFVNSAQRRTHKQVQDLVQLVEMKNSTRISDAIRKVGG